MVSQYQFDDCCIWFFLVEMIKHYANKIFHYLYRFTLEIIKFIRIIGDYLGNHDLLVFIFDWSYDFCFINNSFVFIKMFKSCLFKRFNCSNSWDSSCLIFNNVNPEIIYSWGSLFYKNQSDWQNYPRSITIDWRNIFSA